MAREAPSRGDHFVEVSWGFHGLLACSGVFLMPRWTTLEKVLGVAALWGWPCLVAKSSWGLIWMGWISPYSDLWPAIAQMRGHGLLPGAVLSHHARVGGGALLGGYASPGLGCLWRC
jgi:hypothetical protein